MFAAAGNNDVNNDVLARYGYANPPALVPLDNVIAVAASGDSAPAPPVCLQAPSESPSESCSL